MILKVALTQVQDLALDRVELSEVHIGLLLKPVKVPLDGICDRLKELTYINVSNINRAAFSSGALSTRRTWNSWSESKGGLQK